ncbi:Protein of unknown function [Bacillus toyonensis]|nr:hypothetical protein [Bacillus sp. LEw-kw-2]SCN15362.1 Protein of unknown function [Bacillus toyonensis]
MEKSHVTSTMVTVLIRYTRQMVVETYFVNMYTQWPAFV